MIISTQLTIIRNSLACPKKNLDYSLIIFSMQYRLRFKTKNLYNDEIVSICKYNNEALLLRT